MYDDARANESLRDHVSTRIYTYTYLLHRSGERRSWRRCWRWRSCMYIIFTSLYHYIIILFYLEASLMLPLLHMLYYIIILLFCLYLLHRSGGRRSWRRCWRWRSWRAIARPLFPRASEPSLCVCVCALCMCCVCVCLCVRERGRERERKRERARERDRERERERERETAKKRERERHRETHILRSSWFVSASREPSQIVARLLGYPMSWVSRHSFAWMRQIDSIVWILLGKYT